MIAFNPRPPEGLAPLDLWSEHAFRGGLADAARADLAARWAEVDDAEPVQ